MLSRRFVELWTLESSTTKKRSVKRKINHTRPNWKKFAFAPKLVSTILTLRSKKRSGFYSTTTKFRWPCCSEVVKMLTSTKAAKWWSRSSNDFQSTENWKCIRRSNREEWSARSLPTNKRWATSAYAINNRRTISCGGLCSRSSGRKRWSSKMINNLKAEFSSKVGTVQKQTAIRVGWLQSVDVGEAPWNLISRQSDARNT